jgi:NAD(P)H-nitrite reductase large subunit
MYKHILIYIKLRYLLCKGINTFLLLADKVASGSTKKDVILALMRRYSIFREPTLKFNSCAHYDTICECHNVSTLFIFKTG